MIIHTAKFQKSSGSIKDCPQTELPEFAFIGRSNVGKSSLINMLTNNKKLAHISSNPGKTQCINHYIINDTWFLVDLPGYGYAKVSKDKRAIFGKMIQEFIAKRDKLVITFVLIDSRIEPQKIDLEFINWLGENGIPFALAFTKTDKLSSVKLESAITSFKKALQENWEEMPMMFVTSANEKTGRDELLWYINDVIQSMKTAQ